MKPSPAPKVGTDRTADRVVHLLRDTSGLCDEEIVERVLAGEKALFEVLVRRYNTRLYRVAFSILGNEAEAEDVMQEAYVRAYGKLDQFEGRAAFSTWLTKIAAYAAWARVRRRRRLVSLEQMLGGGAAVAAPPQRVTAATAEQRVHGGELRRALEESIAELPEAYRTVYMLREVEELDTGETAEALGLSESAIKVRLHRARRMLRRSIACRLEDEAPALFDFLRPRCDRMVAAVFAAIRSLPEER